MNKCQINDCNKKYYAKGYCRLHWERNHKFGSPYVCTTYAGIGRKDYPDSWMIWYGIVQRTEQVGNTNYPNYGGRGIKVCERWRNSFQAFLEDMGERPKGMSIERIDANGNYELSNCKWATTTEQAANKRNSIKVVCRGVEMCLNQAAALVGISGATAWWRFKNNREIHHEIQRSF